MLNDKMKIVFIAGLLTTGWDGEDRDYIQNNVNIAEAYQIALANAGIGAFCPHTHTQFHREKGSTIFEEYYYRLDLEFLYRISDAILAIPGWEKSVGANNEVKWAIKNNLPVFYPKSPDEIEDIIAWNKN